MPEGMPPHLLWNSLNIWVWKITIFLLFFHTFSFVFHFGLKCKFFFFSVCRFMRTDEKNISVTLLANRYANIVRLGFSTLYETQLWHIVWTDEQMTDTSIEKIFGSKHLKKRKIPIRNSHKRFAFLKILRWFVNW